jgi:hypothetical protein
MPLRGWGSKEGHQSSTLSELKCLEKRKKKIKIVDFQHPSIRSFTQPWYKGNKSEDLALSENMQLGQFKASARPKICGLMVQNVQNVSTPNSATLQTRVQLRAKLFPSNSLKK